MNKLVVIFVEGDTEVEFYKGLIKYYSNLNGGRLNCKVEYGNVKGVGNYQSKVVRIFKKRIIPKCHDCECHVFLCYDSDVFEFKRNLHVDWDSVGNSLMQAGAASVEHVIARQSIEDWFLYDKAGLRKFLKLPGNFQMNGYSGQNGLKDLFRKANRIYIKGSACKGLVDALDMSVIVKSISSEIQELEHELKLSAPPKTLCSTDCTSSCCSQAQNE